MRPLEAAKALAAGDVTENFDTECPFCGIASPKKSAGAPFPHDTDCLWLQMPSIVTALEAAERYLMEGRQKQWFEAALALGLVEIVETDGVREYRVPVGDQLVMASTSQDALRGGEGTG